MGGVVLFTFCSYQVSNWFGVHTEQPAAAELVLCQLSPSPTGHRASSLEEEENKEEEE